MISTFAGNWKLLKNDANLDAFMSFYGYGYLARKAAMLVNIHLKIVEMADNTLFKTVSSTFMNIEELYLINGKENEPSREGLVKTHTFSAGTLISTIYKQSDSEIKWTETMALGDNGTALMVTRYWNSQSTTQTFIKDAQGS